MNNIKFLTLLSISLLLFQCKEEEYPIQEQLKKDKSIIDSYAKENGIAGSYIYNDIYTMTTTPSPGGDAPEKNFGVRVKAKLSLLDGTVIDSSTTFYQHDQQFYFAGWEAAVGTLQPKEAAIFLIPSYYGFGSAASTKGGITIPANSVLRLDMELLDKVPPQAVAHAYGHFKGLTGVVDSTGIFYSVTHEGAGAKPEAGQSVTVKYKGYLLNGFKFDESESFTFVLGGDNVIKGWNRAVSLLKVGDKATIAIPSSQAYDNEPIIKDGKLMIPANAAIVFDIEILDAK